MFTKTLKYDFLFSRGKFFGMAVIMILIAIGLRLNEQPGRLHGGVGGAESTVLLVVMLSIGVVAIFQVMGFFIHNFFEEPGYLMLTLPVKRVTSLASKLVVSMVWFNFMLLAAATSVIIFDSRQMRFTFLNLSRDISFANLVALVEVNIVAALFILTIFAAIVLARVGFDRWHGLVAWIIGLMSVGFYFWLFTWIATRHSYDAVIQRENITSHYCPYGYYPEVFPTLHIMHVPTSRAIVGLNVGRIPIGDYGAFFDIYLYGATLLLAVAVFWVVNLLLKKHINV